jgi:peptidase M28-like protein
MFKRQSHAIAVICVLVLASASAAAQRKDGPARGNIEGVTAAQMKDYLTLIASDEMEGRNTPSRGLDLTAKYLASQLSRWGLKPAGDAGGYFQRIALRRSKIDSPRTSAEINGQAFNYGEDFLASVFAGSVSGQLVYVSHGWVIKSKSLDPYQSVDVKDKIVVVNSVSLPKGVAFNELGRQGEDFEAPRAAAQKRGAKGIIYIPSFAALANWDGNRQSAITQGAVFLDENRGPQSASIPAITISPKALSALFGDEKINALTAFNRAAANEPGESFAFNPEKQASFTVGVKSESVSAQNVVAVLEGGDAALKNEYVALGAHYDHVGVGNPVNGDAIYNGADDDGSGTAAVLALAEAFAKGPRPKRSLLFIWHAGEEEGLWGSAYFTKRPTVPINQIVTLLNMDMIGRCRREGDTHPKRAGLAKLGEVFVVGSKMMSAELGELSEAVNRGYLNLSFNYKYDDPKDPERIFFRSDHFNYALQGVPIIFYTDGEHEDYHQPSDTVDKIDFEQMEKITRTVYATAWELGNRAQRPRVDKKLPAEMMGN